MHDNDIEPVIYQVFAEMCKTLKEQEGIMNKAIAIDMGIGFSIFSKLLSGKRPISSVYADKIYNYLNQEKFEKYAPCLISSVCSSLDITRTNILYRRMASKSYKDLLYYLFYEFNLRDLTMEMDLKNLFMSYVKSFFNDLLRNHPEECLGYELVTDQNISELEKTAGLSANCIMVAGKVTESALDKVCILVCPHGWNNESRIFSNPILMKDFSNYMVVRLKEKQVEHIFSVDRSGDFSDSLAEFETISVGKISRYARELAEIMFKKFCYDLAQ